MKKVALLLLGVVLLASCGGDKKKEETPVEKAEDKYTVSINALYEKNDEVICTFKRDGYWDYDHPVKTVVTGMTTPQVISIDVPDSKGFENVQIDLSTNKEQKLLTLTGVSIMQNEKYVIDGRNMGFVPVFNMGPAMTWDAVQMRYNLFHDQQYPPRVMGNEKVEQILFK